MHSDFPWNLQQKFCLLQVASTIWHPQLVLHNTCCNFFHVLQAAEATKLSTDPLAHKNASYSSSQDILKFITNLGISKVRCQF